MENLTSQQATDLSNLLLDLNKSIEDFRFDGTKNFSDKQKQQLDDFMEQISESGQKILALSTTLVMNDVQTSLSQINDVTNQIKGTIKNLQNIQKGINVAASIVTLGAAIISKNPQSIVDSISGVVDAWNA